jgi:hypothetical protein
MPFKKARRSKESSNFHLLLLLLRLFDELPKGPSSSPRNRRPTIANYATVNGRIWS